MKRGLKQGLPDRQHGFSLLELLIATSIGMVITVGAIAVFSNSTGASKTTEAQSRMNEDAQAALSLLSREIKMAGNNPIISVTKGKADRNPISALTLRSCSGTFTADINSISDDKLRCEIGSPSQSHSLFLRYEADPWNTTASSGRPTDCLGNKLTPPAGSPNIAENRYYINTSPIIQAREGVRSFV
jgi:type IV pilus assembly protein PilW